ncbi:SLBB domain-containing protein [Daejeonella lutea]|uniref:Protein involved in polysaccharide export, contains SLBB domain of the beta-grasp fold n=1 Tax=Daejeonella lutea TaxID=572036 RepID=A0A1T5FCR6_9SPHI|nr:SLBB domain-containing protein [Daejeonella lutea]SKB93876.1 protein involved in polysaccharide export, contains SLBB domain of the beta-grasp fold [Daejeonella lutea]
MDIKKFVSLLTILVASVVTVPLLAQTAPQNFSNVRVDELSDDQVRAFMRQAEATGLGDSQLEQIAQARGMRPEEVKKLRERVDKLKGDSKAGANRGISPGGRQLNFDTDTSLTRVRPETEAEKALLELRSKIFGADLFRNTNLTFEPNLNMATPKSYVIGPNDQILIDIYGDSEASYSLKVSPEGNINVEFIGPVPVAGLTVEAATAKIRSRLASVYTGLRSGRTNINITIGNIRSIKVILTGEVQKPGTYTLPSLATVFNALYSSGGPTENGSFRVIEVIRGGKKVAVLDIYDFLMKGEMTNNLRLQDQDIIRVPVYNSRVEMVGEVKRPAIFELVSGESFVDLLNFAGGFTENAFKARIKILKNTDTERRIEDITSEKFSSYRPSTGDKFFIDRVLDRFENRVSINGAVFRPGRYELEQGLTLSGLIRKAEGLKEEAFLPRGYILRLRPDNQSEVIAFDVAGILNGTAPDIRLLREDVVSISSITDLKEEYRVNIDGEVRRPGSFLFAENMTLQDLIVQAGGFKEGASVSRVEVSRRVKNSNVLSQSAATAEVFQIDVDRNLRLSGAPFILQPFDIVSVRGASGYEIQKQVTVTGEVLFPGTYTLLRKDERISDIIRRAGGLTALAHPPGASLKRPGVPTVDSAEVAKEKLETIRRLQSSIGDSSSVSSNIESSVRNTNVGINLVNILENPGSSYDLILDEADIINVPKLLQTIKVSGEVLSPVTMVYEQGKGFKGYISQSGGFSDRSLKRRSYILYANGSVKSTKKILFFNDYPAVTPGAEIFVPKKSEKRPLSAAEIVGISSGLASLAVIILNLVKQ